MTDITVNDPRHGTYNAYINLACRCRPCTDAHTVYLARQRAARPPLEPDDPRHGTNSSYTNWRCRCGPCTEATRTVQARHRRKAAADA